MMSRLATELLKFYEYITYKNVTKTKLEYRVLASLLETEKAFLEVDDFEILLNQNIDDYSNMEISKSFIEYVCDFFKYVSMKDNEKALLAAKSIYKILEDDNISISANEFSDTLKQEVDKLEEEENIKDKIDQAFYYGIGLINDVNAKDIPIMKEVVDSIPNIEMFTIADDTKVVLRNKLDKKEKINTFELYGESRRLFYEKDYDGCIDALLLILRNGKMKLNIYGHLGLCYMMQRKYTIAIDYLTIATILNTQNNPKYDYTNLIYDLQNRVRSENDKVQFRMRENEFYDDISDNYGITCLEDIITSVNSGFTIEDACKFMNLTEEQLCLVYLIYAKECYYHKKYKNGDMYFNIVSKVESKSDYLKKVLESVRVNKYYYKNRKRREDTYQILKLSKK